MSKFPRAFETLIDLAGIYLTDSPEATFTLEQLVAKATEIQGSGVSVEEVADLLKDENYEVIHEISPGLYQLV